MDLDSWICNLYFQIERIKLSDIKVHRETKDLYYAPLVKPKMEKTTSELLTSSEGGEN